MYLTFDLDHARDECINLVLAELRARKVRSTWFITHTSELIDQMRFAPDIEIGIHPDFVPFLGKDPGMFEKGYPGSPQERVDDAVTELKKLVPEAISVRSHGLVDGAPFMRIFTHYGLLINCNPYIPYQHHLKSMPWALWDQMTMVPFVWSDYSDVIKGNRRWDWQEFFRLREVFKCVAFHPVHICYNGKITLAFEDLLNTITKFGIKTEFIREVVNNE